jgi:predicted ATP-dependent protease
LKAAIYQKLNENEKSVTIAKENIKQLVFDVSNQKKRIETITFKDVKELVSTTFIAVFYQTGKVYLNHYR